MINHEKQPQDYSILEEEMAAYEAPLMYVAYLHQKYRHKVLQEALFTLSLGIEPEDRVLGADSEVPAAKAFYYGGLLGLRVAEQILGKDFDKRILNNEAELYVPDGINLDDAEKKHLLAAAFINIAEEGYAKAPGYHELIESLEMQLCPEVRNQIFIKRGFGIVIYQVLHILEVDQQKELEIDKKRLLTELEAMDSEAWDAEIQKLLSNE